MHHSGPRPPPCPQCVAGGILRGTGRQAFGAIVNAVMYYIVGLPLGIVLAFIQGMRIMGTRPGVGEEGGSGRP